MHNLDNNNIKLQNTSFAFWSSLILTFSFFIVSISFILYLKNQEKQQNSETLQSTISQIQNNFKVIFRGEKANLIEINNLLRYSPLSIEEISENPTFFFKHVNYLISNNEPRIAIGFINTSKGNGFYIKEPRGKVIEINETTFFSATMKNAITRMLHTKQNTHSAPYLSKKKEQVIGFIEPIFKNRIIVGYIFSEATIKGLFYSLDEGDLLKNNLIAILDENNNPLTSVTMAEIDQHYANLSYFDKFFKTQPIITSAGETRIKLIVLPLKEQSKFALILILASFFLCLMTVISIIINIELYKIRSKTQKALIQETNFRRALANSMPVGIRVLDMHGITTYVNHTFCQMLVIDEQTVLGKKPPLSYWNKNIRDQTILNSVGKTLPPGFKATLKKMNEEEFNAQIFVSPLNNSEKQQIGWIIAILDISEAEKIRLQLTNSFLQFTTVLEAIDASVSVALIGKKELVFSNKLYRKWFEKNSTTHFQLLRASSQTNKIHSLDDSDNLHTESSDAEKNLGFKSTEIFIPALNRWLEVRSRYLTWTNGQLAQMLISSDITERRHAQEQSAIQAAQLSNQSRLIALGEIASSVAHELNQPLTAISNYCNGLISRIKSKKIEPIFLIEALEKILRQSHRASQIIQRIRILVKRRQTLHSHAEVNQIVNEAIESSSLELIKHNVQINNQTNQDLPMIYADPILIEQVLTNLIKNAAESIDIAKRPKNQRIIKIQVESKVANNNQGIEFCVYDSGTGLPEDIKDKIFDSFFTTKEHGMGIGLKLCRSIIESHHGNFTANNICNSKNEVTGCCFIFWLPTALL